MSTEAGVVTGHAASRNIAIVRARVEWLEARCAARVTEGKPDRNGRDLAEIAALTWALPLMEAEADFIRRLQTVLIPDEIRAHR